MDAENRQERGFIRRHWGTALISRRGIGQSRKAHFGIGCEEDTLRGISRWNDVPPNDYVRLAVKRRDYFAQC